jgi:CubicO group peptidase (beta-lactamase class C family)
MCLGPSCARRNEHALESNVDKLMHPLVDEDLLSGSILIARGDAILLAKGYGHANREHDVRNTSRTVFRIASMTKTFTSMSILLLWDRGLVCLDDPLSRFLPDFPDADRITIHRLLTNTSGLNCYVFHEGYLETWVRGYTLDEVIEWFRDQPWAAEAGERFVYSNSNFALLAKVVEVVSGQGYGRFLRENIFVPLGMENTGVDSSTLLLRNRASGYSRMCERVQLAEYKHFPFGLGDGGLYSTVEDLYRWGQAFRSDLILSDSARSRMFTPYTTSYWEEDYGYGCFVGERLGRTFISGAGGTSGFMSRLQYYPTDEVLVVSLFNMDFIISEEVESRLAAIALGEPRDPLFREEITEEERGRYLSLAGQYLVEEGCTLRLRVEDAEIFVRESGELEYRACPISGDRLFVKEMNMRLDFGPGEDGSPARFTAQQGIFRWTGERLNEPMRD